MSQFGARAEYALHTLLNLAAAGTVPSARDLADFQRLPTPFVRKLLTELRAHGLVRGVEGRYGGWGLARAAAEITILQIVDAASPGQPLFDCREIRTRCALWDDEAPPERARTGTCEIHAVMLAAERAMRAELARVTLDDVARRVTAKSARYLGEDLPAWFASRLEARRGPAATGVRRP